MTYSLKRICSMALSIVAGTMVFVPFFTHAQLSPNNPFIDDSDSGSAEKVNVIGTSSGQKDAFVNVVRGYINWVLGILGLIALIFLMYGGFLMVTSAGDEEKYKKGFTILRHGAIGLILIGVARFIVSIVFWLINLTGKAAGPAGTG